MRKICPKYEKGFETVDKRQKYCSRECYNETNSKYSFHRLRTKDPKEYQRRLSILEGRRPYIKYDFHNLRTTDKTLYSRKRYSMVAEKARLYQRKRNRKLGDFLKKHLKVYDYQKYRGLEKPTKKVETWKNRRARVSRLKGKFVSWRLWEKI